MNIFVRNVPNAVDAEIKRIAKRKDVPIAQVYRDALKQWYELEQKGAIR
jgi:uncharacterized protein (DUF111 family)